MAMRKPASVLPEPVGAAMRTSEPRLDERPPLGLRLGRPLRETGREPAGDGRVQVKRARCERHGLIEHGGE